jgi:hypothetical protein
LGIALHSVVDRGKTHGAGQSLSSEDRNRADR